MTTGYAEFLESKSQANTECGFAVADGDINQMLFPFQRDLVRWALRMGRAAIFADCGLGKTPMQLEWANQVAGRSGKQVLILAPLAVSAQTEREASKFNIDGVRAVRSPSDDRVMVCNYEMLEHFADVDLGGVVLDESSILKSYTGHYRNALIERFCATPYRLACTATPAPNDHMELGNHSEFLGNLSRVEMLAMYFVHDSSNTQKWRIKGHAENEFWKWVCSWAAMLRAPSDLGYDDDGFTLPELRHHSIVVESDAQDGMLFPVNADTLQDRLSARRSTIETRASAAAKLINAKPGPWIAWCNLNAESEALKSMIDGAVEIRGSEPNDVKARKMLAFSAGEIRVLVTKPSIAGFGMNWQHCSQVAFVGLSDSYEQYYQAVRRCWRFGQERPVDVHIVTAQSEGAVVANIRRKERDADRMANGMVRHMAEFTKSQLIGGRVARSKYAHETSERDGWTLHLGDCVDVMSGMESDSIHYSVFSPPFASLYTYSDSERDMGNSADAETFERHFGFAVRELARILMPGRLVSVHCMNLPSSKAVHGYIGVRDFRGDIIRLFESHGMIFHSEVCIWKDPVTAMQRTKALGLLWKQLKKDAAMSRQGIPDYVVTFRKPGENREPIANTAESYPVAVWQKIASPVWTDINQSDVLDYRAAREDKDERHICPLQLEVVRRCVRLWSNEGDVVLSPFAGIGSEGYVAVKMGRRFIGVELKRSYYDIAIANMDRATIEKENEQRTLFSEVADEVTTAEN